MKKICYYGLVLAMLVAMVNPVPVQAVSFSDISKHWAKDSILELASLGYVAGYPGGSFKPDNSMTRAEFATVLISGMGVGKSSSKTPAFADVKNSWAMGSINAAVEKGVLVPSEYPNGLYPNGPIKRSEVAAMLVRALGGKPDNGPVPPFEDKANVEKSMYKGYIKTAFDMGLMAGYTGGKFVPFGPMTRGQICKVMSLYLDKKGGAKPVATQPVHPVTPGGIQTLVLGDQSYSLGSNSVLFKMASEEISATTLSASSNAVLLNGRYPIALDTTLNNPDLIINNLVYKVGKYSLSGDKLSATQLSRSIYMVNVNSHKYNAYYVKLYMNGSYGENYLSDMQIVDAYTVSVAGKNYSLGRDRLTIELGGDAYDITGIVMTQSDNSLVLTSSSAVLKKGLSRADFAAIFVGTNTINVSAIRTMDFIIAGTRYAMSNVNIDANGDFYAEGKTISPDKVVMTIDSVNYKINTIQKNLEKYIVYCSESNVNEWVIVNGNYRDLSEIRIQKDGAIYTMDQAIVVGRNLIQIAGKRYTLDSTFRCLMDNKSYTITRADYDGSVQATVLTIEESQAGYLAGQPLKYVFFVDNIKFLDGVSSAVQIKVGSTWISFNNILIPDPAHFTYNNIQYNLIGTLVRINQKDYVVIDTSWHGVSQALDLYLQ